MFMVVLEAAATQLEVSTDFSGSFSGNLSSGFSFSIYNASRSANTGAQIARLEQALRDKDNFIKSANEEQQSSNEELK
jgi:hypothetical protein